jgi:3-deoxy-D-manno-octulosonic-acid transferase
VQVQTPEALSEYVCALLQQPERRQALGDAAYQVLRDNQGALARTVALIEQMLG